MSTEPQPVTPEQRQQAAAGIADILNAALEHVPPVTRGLLGRSANQLLPILAGPEAPQVEAEATVEQDPPTGKKNGGRRG